MTSTCRVALSLTALTTGLVLGTPAYSRTEASAFMPISDVADAPSGFVEMCARDAGMCMAGHREKPAAAKPAMWTGRLADVSKPGRASTKLETAEIAESASVITSSEADDLNIVKTINTQVNRAIRPVADYITAGTSERWSRPGRGEYLVGDCEDYAIEKRMRLIEGGFSPTKLFFSAAYIKGYGMHIVLIARLQSGDVVLDNLSPHIMPWSKVRYSWLRIQSAEDPLIWHRFGNQPQTAKLAVTTASDSQS